MVQCKRCKLFLSTTKDDIVRCKGACEGVFHKRCGKRVAQKEICDDCAKKDGTPQPSKIDVDPSKLTVENLLQEVNKKLEIVFKIEDKLQELTGIVDFYSERYQELVEFKETTEKKVTALERKQVYLEKYNKALEERVEQMEQKEKERNVEIVGLEKQDNENLPLVISNIAEKLNLNPKDIEEVKRVGSEKVGEKQNRPRPVIVTLRSKTARDIWIKQRKVRLNNDKIYGNGSKQNVFINEDLTKYKRQLFWSAKTQLKPQFNFIWIQNTNILVKKNELEKKIYNIRCEEDIKFVLTALKERSEKSE